MSQQAILDYLQAHPGPQAACTFRQALRLSRSSTHTALSALLDTGEVLADGEVGRGKRPLYILRGL